MMLALVALFAAAGAPQFARAQAGYGPAQPQARPQPTCARPPDAEPNEIIVCAPWDDPNQHRIASLEDAQNRYARETMNRGNPPPPDVAGEYIFHGPPTVSGICVPGVTNCPPPPAYMVDFSQLPDTPPGSDADRVGRGLTPTGNEGPAPVAAPTPPPPPPPSPAPEG